MPIEMSWQNQGVIFHCTGLVSAQDIHRAHQRLYSDERSDHLRYQLIDFRPAETLVISDRENAHIIANDLGASCSLPHMRVAFVCPKTSMLPPLQDYVQAMQRVPHWEIRIIHYWEEAIAWVTQA